MLVRVLKPARLRGRVFVVRFLKTAKDWGSLGACPVVEAHKDLGRGVSVVGVDDDKGLGALGVFSASTKARW